MLASALQVRGPARPSLEPGVFVFERGHFALEALQVRELQLRLEPAQLGLDEPFNLQLARTCPRSSRALKSRTKLSLVWSTHLVGGLQERFEFAFEARAGVPEAGDGSGEAVQGVRDPLSGFQVLRDRLFEGHQRVRSRLWIWGSRLKLAKSARNPGAGPGGALRPLAIPCEKRPRRPSRGGRFGGQGSPSGPRGPCSASAARAVRRRFAERRLPRRRLRRGTPASEWGRASGSRTCRPRNCCAPAKSSEAAAPPTAKKSPSGTRFSGSANGEPWASAGPGSGLFSSQFGWTLSFACRTSEPGRPDYPGRGSAVGVGAEPGPVGGSSKASAPWLRLRRAVLRSSGPGGLFEGLCRRQCHGRFQRAAPRSARFWPWEGGFSALGRAHSRKQVVDSNVVCEVVFKHAQNPAGLRKVGAVQALARKLFGALADPRQALGRRAGRRPGLAHLSEPGLPWAVWCRAPARVE